MTPAKNTHAPDPEPRNPKKMHTLQIPDKNITIELPEHWDECTHEQRDYILSEVSKATSGSQSLMACKANIFVHLTDLHLTPNYIVRNRKGLADTTNERITLLAEKLCAWPFTTVDDEVQVQYNSIVNPYPEIKHKGKTWKGPADLLQDLTFLQFRTALADLSDITKNQNEETVHQFIENLYTPNPEPRTSQPAPRTPLPAHQAQAILLWFTYCIQIIQTTPLEIQGSEIDFSVLFPKNSHSGESENTQPQTLNNLGWTALLFDISESGVFGTTQDTDKTNIYTILMFLLKKYQDNQKLKNRK